MITISYFIDRQVLITISVYKTTHATRINIINKVFGLFLIMAMPNQISKRRAMLREEHYENLVSLPFLGGLLSRETLEIHLILQLR